MTQKPQDLHNSKDRNKTENQKDVLGIHHVTAIARNPQKSIDFYTEILGLRLVKLTVNFDDPTTYHLYFGDETGRPGTILTFFPWPDAPKGRRGTGQVVATSFLIPVNSVNYWIDRLRSNKIEFRGPRRRFKEGEEVLTFSDPDGLELELVSHKSAQQSTLGAWKNGPIPIKY